MKPEIKNAVEVLEDALSALVRERCEIAGKEIALQKAIAIIKGEVKP